MSIDLSLFCDPDHPRSFMQRPFAFGDGAAACNGHVIAYSYFRGAAEPPFVTLPETLPEHLRLSLEAACAPEGEWIAAGDVILEGPDCPLCNTTGQALACKECDSGEFDHGSHTYTCKACGGTGYASGLAGDVRCPNCLGTKYRYGSRSSIGTQGHTLQACYVALIAQLPGAEIRNAVDGKGRIFFRFSGGYGCAMSFRGEPLAVQPKCPEEPAHG